jgi:hypothetical protein
MKFAESERAVSGAAAGHVGVLFAPIGERRKNVLETPRTGRISRLLRRASWVFALRALKKPSLSRISKRANRCRHEDAAEQFVTIDRKRHFLGLHSLENE